MNLVVRYWKLTVMGIWYRIKRAIYRLLGMKIEQEIVKKGSKAMQTSSTKGIMAGSEAPSSGAGTTTAGAASFAFDPEIGVRRAINQWVAIPRSGRQHIIMEEEEFQKLDKSDHDFLLDLDTRYENMNDETRNRFREIFKKLS